MADFNSELVDVLQYQVDTCESFRKIGEKCGITTKSQLEGIVESQDWAALPALFDRTFKKSAGLYAKLKFDVQGTWHISSSTSGDPSYVWRTPDDEQLLLESYIGCYKHATKPDLDVMISFSPAMIVQKNLSKRYDLHDGTTVKVQSMIPTTAAEKASTRRYIELVKVNVPKTIWQTRVKKIHRPVLEINTNEFEEALSEAKENHFSVCFGGSPIFMNQLFKMSKKFPKPDDLYILTGGGGWDGMKGALSEETIDKAALIRMVGTAMDIPEAIWEKRFWDDYGVTEKVFSCIGHWSADQNDFVYSTDDLVPETKIIAKDLITGDAIKEGNGVVCIISPYGNEGAPTAVIQESDEITVLSTNADGSVKEFTGIKRIPEKNQAGSEGVDKIGCAGTFGNIDIT
jgi:hypothetical protein